MKKWLVTIGILLFGFALGFLSKEIYTILRLKSKEKAPEPIKIIPKPLEKYSINNLKNTKITSEKIKIEELLTEEKNYKSYLFSINLDPTLKNKDKKKITGVLNIPNGETKFPIILMLRGYVDQKIYESGLGTRRGAEYFANNEFITIAPDFLGYASSDTEAENIFESRFQTYTTTLSVLSSLNSIPQWDGKNISIWGHSNGGQIALTILEITGKTYPTVLWAPVSKPFPYSILYYTDQSDDLGKLIRYELSLFEEYYDVNNYSIHTYFSQIKAPLQIHQGTFDDAVPYDWTDNLAKILENLEIEVDYFKYYGADHNLQPSWNTAVERSLNFFINNLEN